MTAWIYVLTMVAAGVLIAFQSPINASLARSVGVFESALVSFLVGTLAAAGVVIAAGKGHLSAVTTVPVWQLLGGILGVAYVTTIIVAVPRIGVTTMMVAALLGQVGAGVLIDRNGWFGVPVRTLDAPRMAGVALLFVAMWLINGRR